MRNSFVWITVLKAAVVLPLVAACATANPGGQRPLSPAARLAYLRDSLRSTRGDAAPARSAREPRVRIIAPTSLNLNRTVDAAVRLSDDAYIIVVATDLDGRARVVYPETPEESGFVKAGTRYRLPSFFAGFGSQVFSGYSVRAFYSPAQYSRPPSGAILAVASDRPLQLGRLADRNGDWDETAIERLVFGRNVQSATYSLGDHLVLTGQQFDTDYSGFVESAGTSMYALAMVQGGCMADQTDPMNFYGPPSTRYFESNGVLYAVVVLGDPCKGYYTQTIPVGPANTPRDSLGTPGAPTDSSAASRAASNGARGRFAGVTLDDVIGRARRSTPVGDESMRVQPNDRPMSEPDLRFRPPEQLRAEPRPHERPIDEVTRPAPVGDDERLRPAPPDRRPPRAEPAYREAPRQEPARTEPARTEPMRVEPARVEPSAPPAEPPPSRKPTKDE
jgi:hypothetical protein